MNGFTQTCFEIEAKVNSEIAYFLIIITASFLHWCQANKYSQVTLVYFHFISQFVMRLSMLYATDITESLRVDLREGPRPHLIFQAQMAEENYLPDFPPPLVPE